MGKLFTLPELNKVNEKRAKNRLTLLETIEIKNPKNKNTVNTWSERPVSEAVISGSEFQVQVKFIFYLYSAL